MLNQLSNERQPQSVEYIEQYSRILVQLIGDFEEPRTTLSGGEVPGVSQVQPSGSRIDIHNDNLISAKGDPQARDASWEAMDQSKSGRPVRVRTFPVQLSLPEGESWTSFELGL